MKTVLGIGIILLGILIAIVLLVVNEDEGALSKIIKIHEDNNSSVEDKFNALIEFTKTYKEISGITQSYNTLEPKVNIQNPVVNGGLENLPEGNMVNIPSGRYRMGSENWGSSRRPVHWVSIDAFRMSQTEVVYSQWDACVDAGGCSYRPRDYGRGRGIHPVTVSYKDITQQFIPWLNEMTGKYFRLPSEAEWEYSARAGSDEKYSWGKEIGCGDARFNFFSCGHVKARTVPVASYKPNAFGLYDMHGNVSEWTEDCWNDSYRGAPINGAARKDGECGLRVTRGGSWRDESFSLHSAARDFGNISSQKSRAGFRLVEVKIALDVGELH